MLSTVFAAKPLVVGSSLNRICANLALEQVLVKKAKRAPVLFLWRNSDCLIIGRHQNPHSELNVRAAKEDNVDIARRFTGGGAVFQDLGNTVFTFIFPRSKINRKLGNEILLEALEKHGIKAEASGRNDLTVEGKKFSGAAFQQTSDAFVHHGTIIRETNLEKMMKYLTPHPMKLKAGHSVPSVKSRVTELRQVQADLSHDKLMDSIIASFEEKFGTVRDTRFHVDHLSTWLQEPEFLEPFEQLRSQEWVFGKTKPYSESVWFKDERGIFEVLLDVKNGKISDVKVCSDCLDVNIPRRVERVLRHKLAKRAYKPALVQNCLTQWQPLSSHVVVAEV
eukprot:Gregarina_sp_Pseudo_9__1789@NODE_2216_length_1092_cov_10_147198_g2041_i0_p1_GENE_NODE_2216_length_1092_cov_10_147198_g2041_i0NODE_2216_length_1092_cov_10_147198_g2041_i0_p1_ORF_typecomplete_len336_score54_05BPL_LplA_LipB/PF03099_19/9_8e10Lip_prot_lig_C/PF10437_9/7_7e05DUF2334/PF10096_9/0_16HrcA/PF01628_21/0_21_NODE_2216_length_1092_cov_10_147198_g2041_i0421049